MRTDRKRPPDDRDEENFFKRRKLVGPEEMDDRLKSLIARVFDDTATSSLESNLESLSQVLQIDYFDFKEGLLRVLPQWKI
uniref:Nbl1_Borealin_N domain-containing protein n=1 Tax=Ascaris lumbricoides TaxID=6252 RepID=A0A0M3HPV9_ASCLU